MSVKWMNYIWEERNDLKGSELYCAIAIADHADADGRCFPGIETICKKMRLGERQVQDLIKRLEKKKVFIAERGNGRGNLTGFQFLKGAENFTFNDEEKVQNPTPFEETERVQDSSVKGAGFFQKRVQDSSVKGAGFFQKRVQDSSAPIYKDEPLLEPNINRVNAHAPEAVLAAEEIFGLELPIHSQEAIEASGIENLVLWRKVLTEKKASCGAEWDNYNFRQKQIGYCLANYRAAVERLPKTSAPPPNVPKPVYASRCAEMEARGFPKMGGVNA